LNYTILPKTALHKKNARGHWAQAGAQYRDSRRRTRNLVSSLLPWLLAGRIPVFDSRSRHPAPYIVIFTLSCASYNDYPGLSYFPPHSICWISKSTKKDKIPLSNQYNMCYICVLVCIIFSIKIRNVDWMHMCLFVWCEVMITGGAGATVLYNLKKRHPTLDLPVIDYDLALLFQPMLMLGISLGVAFNLIFPDWMLTTLLIIFFTGN